MDKSKKYIEMYQKARKIERVSGEEMEQIRVCVATAEDRLHMIDLFYRFCCSCVLRKEGHHVKPYEVLTSIEQLWLAFLVQFKYGKEWDDDERGWTRRCCRCDRRLQDGDHCWESALKTICTACLRKESPRIGKLYETLECEAGILKSGT